MKPLPFLTVLLAASLTIPAFALDWKNQHLSVKAVPLQKSAEAFFEFTNTSGKTVTLKGVDTSCDCLEATPSATTFAPGASGRINARFTVGDRFGVYQRSITVTTDDATEATTLTVELDVPEVASLLPRSVDWKLNGPAAEQVIEIEVTPGITLSIGQVQCTSDAFKHRLETVEAGRHYRLHIEPKNIHEVSNAAFRLYAKAGTGQDVVLSVYGNVR